MAPLPDTALRIPASSLTEWPPSASAEWGDILWCKDPGKDAFLFALDNAPYFLYETTETPLAVNAGFASLAASDALFLLTTLTCYRSPVAEWVSHALTKHYRFSSSLSMSIHTALHEAIANAVIHGNLGIHERFRDTEGFDAYCAHIHTRLSHPQHHSTRIAVAAIRRPGCITLCVSDEGDGHRGNTGSKYSGDFPLGQGLSIIREQCCATRILHGGSTIEMDFTVCE